MRQARHPVNLPLMSLGRMPTLRTMDALVARQPIFNTLGTVVGYELLYRETPTSDSAGATDASIMSARTIVTALVDIGLNELVGASRAWINLPERALLEDDWTLLDRTTVVIEVLETVPVNESTIAAMRRLSLNGFEVALDDFEDAPQFAPFLDLASVVKIDVLGKDPAVLAADVARYKTRGLPVLAERIETQEVYVACRAAGFDLFQGYYFARPEVLTGKRLSPQVAALAEAMNRLADEEFNLRDLDRTFAADPSLTLKLLRIANSAANGSSGVDSVRQAIALERARFAELVAERTDRRRAPAAFFAGLLSMLDVVLGTPLDELLGMINVTYEVRAALMDRLGPLAPPILLAEAVELGLWESARAQAGELGLAPETIQPIVLEAARWTRGIRGAV
jgi:c-di-GMP phosphodiesterase